MLQPNHHFAMHLKEYVKKYGPCYGWWLFAFERFNGILEEIRTNGHPDEAESILARWWVTVHQIHNFLERLPGAATPEEKDVLRQLCSIKSDRGTLLSMTQALHGEDTPVQPSRIGSRFVNLRDLDETGEIYLAVLGFAQRRWPHLNLVSDLDFNSPGRLFLSKNTAKPFQSVIHNTVRYGSASSKRTSADRYALVLGEAGRYPVKILRHFRLEVAGEEPDLCMVVTRLNMNDSPLLPWSINAFDLGYYTAVNDRFEPAEGVSPNQLVSSVTHGTFKC
ncbi:hypothetical protein FRC12_017130 [Ceratobasidium sp. 428]|nr:hypothetical protein FRC12_017130 [Ceratobasidium sp. 428]